MRSVLCTEALAKVGEGLDPSLHSGASWTTVPKCQMQGHLILMSMKALSRPAVAVKPLVPLLTHCELRDSLPVWLKAYHNLSFMGLFLECRITCVGWSGG